MRRPATLFRPFYKLFALDIRDQMQSMHARKRHIVWPPTSIWFSAVPAVCADFERQKGRFPGPKDLDFLKQQARILATGAQADAEMDVRGTGALLPRDLVKADVMPDQVSGLTGQPDSGIFGKPQRHQS